METNVTLIKRAQAGCAESFRTLLLQVESRLYNVGLSIVGNKHDADDLWQETVIRAWRHLPKLKHPDKFKSWIASILVSEVKRAYRKRQKQPIAFAELPERGVTTEEETALYVHDSLRRLSSVQREVVVLRFWADLTLQEISIVLGIPLGTAKTRLYQGMDILERVLREEA